MDEHMRAAAREERQQQLDRIERECLKGSHLGGGLGAPAIAGRRPHFNIFNDVLGMDDPFRSDDRLDPAATAPGGYYDQNPQPTTTGGQVSGGGTAGGGSGQWIAGVDNALVLIAAGAVAFLALRK